MSATGLLTGVALAASSLGSIVPVGRQRLLAFDGHAIPARRVRVPVCRVAARDAKQVSTGLERDARLDAGNVRIGVRVDAHELPGIHGVDIGLGTDLEQVNAGDGGRNARDRDAPCDERLGRLHIPQHQVLVAQLRQQARQAHRAGHDRRVLRPVVGLDLRDAGGNRSGQGARRGRRRRGIGPGDRYRGGDQTRGRDDARDEYPRKRRDTTGQDNRNLRSTRETTMLRANGRGVPRPNVLDSLGRSA